MQRVYELIQDIEDHAYFSAYLLSGESIEYPEHSERILHECRTFTEHLKNKYGQIPHIDTDCGGVYFAERTLSKYITIIEHNLLSSDTSGREALCNRLLIKISPIGLFIPIMPEYELLGIPLREDADEPGFEDRDGRIASELDVIAYYEKTLGEEAGQYFYVFGQSLHIFFEEFVELFDCFGIDYKERMPKDNTTGWAEWFLPGAGVGDHWRRYHREDSLNRTARNKRLYRAFPRTHAIAAVNMLLEKLGVYKNTDKVKIAEFVEAVTGGNINAEGKNTASYKPPTKDAEAAAKDLLEKINL